MIIDAHCHIWEKDMIFDDMAKLMDSVIEELMVVNRDNIYDGSIDRLIQDMDGKCQVWRRIRQVNRINRAVLNSY